MKLSIKNRREKKKLSPKQAAVVLPLLGVLLTCGFGWLAYRDIIVYSDHQIIQADVVSVVRRHTSNKRRDYVRVAFELNGEEQNAQLIRRISTKPVLVEGGTVAIVVHANWPQYVREAREGWVARSLFAWLVALFVVGVIDVLAVKALKPYLPKRPPTL